MSLVGERRSPTDASLIDDLVTSLHEMERAIHHAHNVGIRVASAWAAASAAEGLAPLTGRQFTVEISRANTAVAEALNHSGEGHRFLRRLGKALGYDVTGYGDGSTPPDIA